MVMKRKIKMRCLEGVLADSKGHLVNRMGQSLKAFLGHGRWLEGFALGREVRNKHQWPIEVVLKSHFGQRL